MVLQPAFWSKSTLIWEIGKHVHEDNTEIHYVLEGNGNLRPGGDGNSLFAGGLGGNA